MSSATPSESDLEGRIRLGAYSYLRSLAVAEAAIPKGQFNLAKVLRALAHAQRAQAIRAARQIADNLEPSAALHLSLAETDLVEPAAVREQMKDIVLRSIKSLETNSDVGEADVSQFIRSCFGCGFMVEGETPDSCPSCGAMGAEFASFGPFYIETQEHLGQLTPAEIIAILEQGIDEISSIVSGVDEEVLRRKPAEDEWCANEVVGHILETNILYERRVQTILAERGVPDVNSAIPPWKLQEGKGYEDTPVDDILIALREVRSRSVDLVKQLTSHQWGQQGTANDSTITLLDLGTWVANHDRGHIAHIQQLCDA